MPPGASGESRSYTGRGMRCSLHAANVMDSRTEVLSVTMRNWIDCSKHLRRPFSR